MCPKIAEYVECYSNNVENNSRIFITNSTYYMVLLKSYLGICKQMHINFYGTTTIFGLLENIS